MLKFRCKVTVHSLEEAFQDADADLCPLFDANEIETTRESKTEVTVRVSAMMSKLFSIYCK